MRLVQSQRGVIYALLELIIHSKWNKVYFNVATHFVTLNQGAQSSTILDIRDPSAAFTLLGIGGNLLEGFVRGIVRCGRNSQKPDSSCSHKHERLLLHTLVEQDALGSELEWHGFLQDVIKPLKLLLESCHIRRALNVVSRFEQCQGCLINWLSGSSH